MKRKKKYRPKPVFDPISMAITGVSLLNEKQKSAKLDGPNYSYQKLRLGTATRDDWNLICQAINFAEALTEQHIGDNLLPDFDAAHKALHDLALRNLKGKPMVCRGDELVRIREGLDMYAIQLKFVSVAEFERAVQRVRNLLAGGKVDNVAETYARLNV